MRIKKKTGQLLTYLIVTGMFFFLVVSQVAGSDEFDAFDESVSKLEQALDSETEDALREYRFTAEKQFKEHQQKVERLWGNLKNLPKPNGWNIAKL